MKSEKNNSVLVLNGDALITRISEYDGASITSKVVEAIKDDLSGKLFDGGVNFMTSGAARILAEAWPPEMEMNLDFLFELTADVCVELEAFKGDLVVNCVRSISSDAAEVLSFRKGGISMESLDVTDERVIGSLSKVGGNLILPGCTKISEKAAIALAARKAKTVLNACAEGRLEDFVYLKESLGDLLVLDGWLKDIGIGGILTVVADGEPEGCTEVKDGQGIDHRQIIYLNGGPQYYVGIKESRNGGNIGYIGRNGMIICVYRRLWDLLIKAGYSDELEDKGRMPHGGPLSQHVGNIRLRGKSFEDARKWLDQYFVINNL